MDYADEEYPPVEKDQGSEGGPGGPAYGKLPHPPPLNSHHGSKLTDCVAIWKPVLDQRAGVPRAANALRAVHTGSLLLYIQGEGEAAAPGERESGSQHGGQSRARPYKPAHSKVHQHAQDVFEAKDNENLRIPRLFDCQLESQARLRGGAQHQPGRGRLCLEALQAPVEVPGRGHLKNEEHPGNRLLRPDPRPAPPQVRPHPVRRLHWEGPAAVARGP
ncbi:hypothetical protein OIY81_2968 [Cryptosporidium canis]|nr:hypothetical protein OIY81_2968 [Cryptosporidium canis]